MLIACVLRLVNIVIIVFTVQLAAPNALVNAVQGNKGNPVLVSVVSCGQGDAQVLMKQGLDF